MKSSLGFSIACLTLACGCSTMDLSACRSLWPVGHEKPQQPSSVVAIWTEGVVHQSGGAPLRGFVGRVIFYDAAGTKPVRVDGTLTVYAFDETGRGRSDTRPDRKYVFTPEQLANHYDPVKVGPAYAVWLPWDEAGGSRRETSLIIRFTPRKGTLVVGEMARLVLSGAAPPAVAESSRPAQPADAASANDPMVRPAAYEATLPNQPGDLPPREPAGAGIRSTTIQLPENLSRRLAAARPTAPQRNGRTTVIPGGLASARAATDGMAPSPGGWETASRVPLTASSAPAASAAFLPSRPPVLPGVHSPLARPRVPGVTVVPLTRDHAASRPLPGAPPYLPSSTPPAEPLPADASTWPAVPPPPN